MDKVHHFVDRHFHDRFAQVKNSAANRPCLGSVRTAKIGTNGAQYLEILKRPFGVSQMSEDIMQFLDSRFIRYASKDMSKDPIVPVPLSSCFQRNTVGEPTLLRDSLVVDSRLKGDRALYIGIGGLR